MPFFAEKQQQYALLPQSDLPHEQQQEQPRRQPRRRAIKHLIVGLYAAAFAVLVYRHELASLFSSHDVSHPHAHGGRKGMLEFGADEEEARRTMTRLLGMPEEVAGFWASGIMEEKHIGWKEAQELFITIPTNDSAHARSVLLASTPHRAGSEGDLITALHVLSHFQNKFGVPVPSDPPIYDAGTPESQSATLSASKFGSKPSAWIDKYFPVMNEPIKGGQAIEAWKDGELLWAAPLEELPLEGDIGGEFAEFIGPWHGLSKNGSASGPLVYAGYGSPEELADALSALRAQGVATEGCIALVQYGKLFRGLKVKAAEEAGCGACIIYSDPVDDNGVVSAVYEEYPAGPARAPTAIQRGSVQYLSLYPGDPTTPNQPAYPNSTRLDGGNIPGIPSLPLSQKNAETLKEIAGGEGVVVKVVNKVNDHVMPIWNVMATIPGHIADEVVIIGNHRDAWVMGAADPTSGSATVHEIVEGFSVLLEKGWKPLRTILFASWDAEEYGLIGSTEWGEDFASWIEDHVVAYLNVDVSASGSRFHIGASPSLAHVVRSSAEAVPHPTDPKRTLWDATKDSGIYTERPGMAAMSQEEASRFRDERVAWMDDEADTRASVLARAAAGLLPEEVGKAEYTAVSALGSGSDYTIFLQHIGVASSDGGFTSVVSDPVYHYHSVYDSVTWMEKFGDPGYHRHAAVAKYLGLSALRISDAIILPINTTQYAFELSYYLQKVQDVAASLSYSFDFSALSEAISSLQSASLALDAEKATAEAELIKELKKYMKHHGPHHGAGKGQCLKRKFGKVREFVKRIFGVKPSPAHVVPKALIKAAKRVRKVNKQLASFERAFISPEGLKDRDWYKNVLVAPGLWLGYGATTFPGLTEAFTIEKDATLAVSEAERLTELINAAAEGLTVKTASCHA
ncbi:Zn-dependent exopeptidase [Calocera cornea HHB12733]|uniref:Zn-dependent exopeptidase n=1 Tax=Calocera cornea HHB12733 TaxID=1353952 RepID=A0A165JVN9_9BASI|nr:Zn-dependent exopeptidase [Calocera cornea HHB12733]